MPQRIEMSRARPSRMPETASVVLTVPAYKDYVVIVRSAVAQLGACFGFTIGEIGDVRLAVDEACNLLVAGRRWSGGGTGGALDCRAEVRGGLLRVSVAATAETAEEPDTEGFGWTILSALVDALACAHDGGKVRIELEKRRTGGDW